MKMALKFNPKIQNVYIVHDNSESSISSYNLIKNYITLSYKKINVSEFDTNNINNILNSIRKISLNSIIIISLSYTRDSSGIYYSSDNIAKIISKASAVPIYDTSDISLGYGIIGGSLDSGIIQGKNAAKLAVSILKGKSPHSLPIVYNNTTYKVVDNNVLSKFNIKKALVPKGVKIINDEPSFYEKNKYLFIAVFIIFFVHCVIIFILLANTFRRKKAESKLSFNHQELVGLYSQLKASEEEMHSQFNQLQEKQEQLRVSEERYHHLAYHDILTGLYNRAYFEDILKLELESSNHDNSTFAILCLDLDDFKNINDTCGHTIGDKLLIQIAEKIKSVISDSNIVSRVSADEFIIILKNISSTQQIKEYADNLISSLNCQINISGTLLDVSASIGIAVSPKDGHGIDELFKNADIAMYFVKNSGKGNYKFFNSSMNENLIEKLKLGTKLREAINNNELTLNYQPQINVKTMKITGFEALLRWNTPEFGFVSPEKFIPIAESNGQIIKIGEWVLREACFFGSRLNKLGFSNIYISINVSIVQLLSDNFIETINNVIKDTSIPPEYIELEITETLLMESFESVLTTLDSLRQMGIKISLDDFGKGYSSLTYLKHLPISTLKLDKLFIDDISIYTNKKGITGLIVSIAHEMEMKVIAEGVEKEEQLDYLKEHDCDMIQGYLISKPLPEKDAVEILNVRNLA